MSRKKMLSLAATATFAMATATSQSADAGFRGMVGHSPTDGSVHILPRVTPTHPVAVHIPQVQIPTTGDTDNPVIRIRRPGPPFIPAPPSGGPVPIALPLPDYHHRWVFRDGGWIIIDDDIEAVPVVGPAVPVAPEAGSTPGPCTCLTKTYTRSGLTVFGDVYTKQSASAPVDSPAGDASEAPTSLVAATAVPLSAVPTNYAGRSYEDYLAEPRRPPSHKPATRRRCPARAKTNSLSGDFWPDCRGRIDARPNKSGDSRLRFSQSSASLRHRLRPAMARRQASAEARV
jgi:hypothetical protein